MTLSEPASGGRCDLAVWFLFIFADVRRVCAYRAHLYCQSQHASPSKTAPRHNCFHLFIRLSLFCVLASRRLIILHISSNSVCFRGHHIALRHQRVLYTLDNHESMTSWIQISPRMLLYRYEIAYSDKHIYSIVGTSDWSLLLIIIIIAVVIIIPFIYRCLSSTQGYRAINSKSIKIRNIHNRINKFKRKSRFKHMGYECGFIKWKWLDVPEFRW